MSLFALSRTIGPVPVDVVVREQHESDLTITTNPVEFGAAVSDHAYVEPKKLMLDAVMASRVGPAAVGAAYQSLLRLQEAREPFDIITGLTLYRDMLIERITVNRDSRFATVLYFTAECREVIIVDTETTASPGDRGQDAANPQRGKTNQSGLSRTKAQAGPNGAPSPAQDRATAPQERGNNVASTATGNNESLALGAFRRLRGGE